MRLGDLGESMHTQMSFPPGFSLHLQQFLSHGTKIIISAGEVVLWVSLADGLNVIPGTHMMEEENRLQYTYTLT